MYKVGIGYTPKGNERWKKFDSIEAASSFCSEVFSRTGIILTIVRA